MINFDVALYETFKFLILPLQEPYRIIPASFIYAGLYVDMRLLKMVYYEFKNEGDGDLYLRYGSKFKEMKK